MLRVLYILSAITLLGLSCPNSNSGQNHDSNTTPSGTTPTDPDVEIKKNALALCRASTHGFVQFGNVSKLNKLTFGCGGDEAIPAISTDRDASGTICASDGIIFDGFYKLFKSGGLKIDLDKMAACKAENTRIRGKYKFKDLSTTFATDVTNVVATGPCADMLQPLRKLGDSCQFSVECQGELTCIATATDPTKLTCQAGAKSANTCWIDSQCAKGLECNKNATSCRKKPTTVGERYGSVTTGKKCTGFGDCKNPCERCWGDNICTAFIPVGGDCSGASRCQNGSRCKDSKTCIAQTGLDGDCSSNPCQDNLRCDNTTKQCIRYPTLGEPCYSLCDVGYCNGTICIDGSLNNNDFLNNACGNDSDCWPQVDANFRIPASAWEFSPSAAFQPLYCKNKICSKRETAGGSCKFKVDDPGNMFCAPGFRCAYGDQCVALLNPGETCSYNADCNSGICNKNKCSARSIDLPNLPREIETFREFIMLGL